jgi:hypothetical protein
MFMLGKVDFGFNKHTKKSCDSIIQSLLKNEPSNLFVSYNQRPAKEFSECG